MAERIYQLHSVRSFSEVRQSIEEINRNFLADLVPLGLVPYSIEGKPREDEKKLEYNIMYSSRRRGSITIWKEWQNPVYFTFTKELTPDEVKEIELHQKRD